MQQPNTRRRTFECVRADIIIDMAVFERRISEDEVSAARKKIAAGASLRGAAREVPCAPSTLSLRLRKAKQAEAHAPAELLSPEAAEPRSDDTPNDPALAEATLRELAASAKSEPVGLRAALSLANRAEPLDELGDDEPDAQPDYDALRDNHPEAAVSFHAVKLAEALTACRAAGIE
jgi:hypothetical protein